MRNSPDRPVVLQLRSGRASARFAPWIGGAIAGYQWEIDGRRFDWLRPTDDAALIDGRAEAVSCFPLVPFSNRVRDGRFSFGGREVRLPVRAEGPHFLHGHGWRAPWTIQDVCADRLALSFSHEADAWPWSYYAEQRFALTEAALAVELTLTNRSDARTRLTAPVRAMWRTDATVLPTRLGGCAPEADPSRGLAVDAVALGNAFVGWDGSAEIAWPDRQARLRMEADAPLRVLVVYTPPEADFFCAEPVSNVTDAFNMPGARRDSGLIVLGAGESVRAAVRFIPRIESVT
jgi:aldose 1-epimerase